MRIVDLENRLPGRVFGPGDEQYDAARQVFTTRGEPAAVVQPTTAQEVAEAVTFAAANAVPLSVRGGGHSASGFGTNDGGLVIDLTRLCDVVLDPQPVLRARADRAASADTGVDVGADRLVHVGAGARWRDVAAALEPHHLVVTSGDTAGVGVGGLTLGGGIGWLVRTHALACDCVRQAQVVTVDGRVLTVGRDEHPDLFWAIRGGGGNFGVVTRFTFCARPVPALVGGRIMIDDAHTARALTLWRDLMRSAPDELNSTFVVMPPFAPEIPPGPQVIVCFAGPLDAARRALAPLLEADFTRGDTLAPIAYPDMLEDGPPVRPPFTFVDGAGFVPELTDDVLGAVTTALAGPAPTVVQVRALGGAFGRVDDAATAFAHRRAEALVAIATILAPDAPGADVTAAHTALAPVTAHFSGLYSNFTTHTGRDVMARMYPEPTLRRLAGIKARYDPGNVLRHNHNVWPTDRRPD